MGGVAPLSVFMASALTASYTRWQMTRRDVTPLCLSFYPYFRKPFFSQLPISKEPVAGPACSPIRCCFFFLNYGTILSFPCRALNFSLEFALLASGRTSEAHMSLRLMIQCACKTDPRLKSPQDISPVFSPFEHVYKLDDVPGPKERTRR